MIIIYIAYWIIIKLGDLKKGSSVENFLDLLSISNTSLLIFDNRYHGYYLHGQNNTGSSEGDLKYL